MDSLRVSDAALANLVDLAGHLLPHAETVAARWVELQLAANPALMPRREELEREHREHLRLLLDAAESGDFRRYFRRVAADGRKMARQKLGYRGAIMAIHFLEQALGEVLGNLFPDRAETYAQLVSLDEVFHVEISILSEQYLRVEQDAIARRERELRARNRQLAALNAIADKLSSSFDAHQILDHALNHLLKVLELDDAAIYLVDEATNELVFTVSKGVSEHMRQAFARRALSADTIQGKVALSPQPTVLEDCLTDPRMSPEEIAVTTAHGICSSISSSLRSGNKLLGAMFLDVHRPRTFTMQDCQFVSSVAHQVSVAFEKARLYGDTHRGMEEATALYEAAKRLQAVTRTYFHICGEARAVLHDSFGYRDSAIVLLEDDSLAVYGDQGRRNGARWQKEIACQLIREGQPLLVPDTAEMKAGSARRYLPHRVRTLAAVPLRVGGEIIGAAIVHRPGPGALSGGDLRVLSSLADYLAAALDSVRQYQQRRHLAIVEERNRLAREIHDVLAHTFAGVIFNLEAADNLLLKGSPAEAQTTLRAAMRSARSGLQEARRSVLGLRPSVLEDMSLVDAIRERLESLSDLGLAVEFSAAGHQALDPETETNLYRVVEEAISNIQKHARANAVQVAMQTAPEAISIVIRDDGIGFDPEDLGRAGGEQGRGLLGMNERMRLMGGTLSIESGNGLGTRLRVELPLKPGRQGGTDDSSPDRG